MAMQKSEMVREAGKRSEDFRRSQRVCYCTPSRRMALSIDEVVLNENIPDPQLIADEIKERVAEQLRLLTGRVDQKESLRTFDTMDTSAAYAIWNEPRFNEEHAGSIVVQAFEQAAVTYQAEEIAAWDKAKAEWEESLRKAAAPRVRQEVAPPVDPAQQRAKNKAQAVKQEQEHKA